MQVNYLVILIFSIAFTFLHAQRNACQDIYNKADSLFKKGEYALAIKKINAFKICSTGQQSKKADEFLLQIYDTINFQREKAISEKERAERLTKIANQRAGIIKIQRDSILNENSANQQATRSLQLSQLSPMLALSELNIGLCFSENNKALLEIRKEIVKNEVLFKNLEGSDRFRSILIDRLTDSTFFSVSSNGAIQSWNLRNLELVGNIKLFSGSIVLCSRLNTNTVTFYGYDKNKDKSRTYSFKIINELKISSEINIPDSIGSQITTMTSGYEPNTIFFGTEKGDLFLLNVLSKRLEKLKSAKAKIVGLICWKEIKKVFYATPFGVYDVYDNKIYFKSSGNTYITYLNFCPSIGDFYIGVGEDLIVYNFVNQKEKALSAIHHSVINSCRCADSTGQFLTTSLDGYSVLWDYNGNPLKTLRKGSSTELYDGFIDPFSHYAITVGGRELNMGTKSDSFTVKYWYLSGLLEKTVEADRFNLNKVIYSHVNDWLITSSDQTKGIKLWNSNLHLIAENKMDYEIATMTLSDKENKIYFGTFDSGITGSVMLDSTGNFFSISTSVTHKGTIRKMVVDTKRNLWSAGDDGKILVQDINSKVIDSLYFDSAITDMSISPDHNIILIAVKEKVYSINLKTKKKLIYLCATPVTSIDWLNNEEFVTINGQFLSIWSATNNKVPKLKSDNNSKIGMISLYIDKKNNLIYTGTNSGYIFCWDFQGKLIFNLDNIANQFSASHIKSICGNSENTILYSADYMGHLTKWTSPYEFLNKKINNKSACK